MKPFFFSSYFITDPDEFGSTVRELKETLKNSFSKHNISMVCFRDKKSENIELLAKTTLDISKEFNIAKVLINGNINLAMKLGFDGVHLTSTQFEMIKESKSKKLYTIISCHTKDEVEKAKELGADAVTYSPIFYKENKGEPKGIENLKQAVVEFQDESFKVIALGGIITKEEVALVRSTHVSGFGSIRYFK
ncbi:MAG: thiamine phosphate synthase [Campylobacterota bacterium]|nr:thiamine phosphate synthase [Campylobacterota bacterium]